MLSTMLRKLRADWHRTRAILCSIALIFCTKQVHTETTTENRVGGAIRGPSTINQAMQNPTSSSLGTRNDSSEHPSTFSEIVHMRLAHPATGGSGTGC